MSRSLRELAEEGHDFDDEVLSQMNPYLTGHVNRFGRYTLNMDRCVAPLDYADRRDTIEEPTEIRLSESSN